MVVRLGLIRSLFLLLAVVTLIACGHGNEPGKNNPAPERVFEEVDLGLSVKWAACNVGASTPSESGSFFAWGELSDKFEFSQNSYLGTEDDAARAIMGGSWRIPTEDEWEELMTGCIWYWTELDSVKGYLLMSKIPKHHDATLFLPAAGYCDDCYSYLSGVKGYYWSASLVSSNSSLAYSVVLNNEEPEWDQAPRYLGFSIRAVRN